MTEEIHALSGAYAVDALDEIEQARFERHLADCTTCRDEVASLVVTAAELSVITETVPPASLRASVLSGIRQVRPLPPLSLPMAPAATDLISRPAADGAHTDDVSDAVDVADAPVVPTGPTSDEAFDSTSDASDGGSVTSITAGRRRSARHRSANNPWRGLVAAGAAAVLVLGGFTIFRSIENNNTPPTVAEQVLDAPDAAKVEHTFPNGGTATIVRSPSLGKAVLVGTALPALDQGKTYQLWLQSKDSAFTSAGLVPGSGDQVVVLEGSAADAAGAGITVEPAGGSKQPTTEPVALYPFSA